MSHPAATDRRTAAPLQGALYMSAAAVAMALVGTSVKWATHDLPSPVVVFFRNLFSFAALLPWLLRPGRAPLRSGRVPLHLLRVAFGVAAMFCYFHAISGMRLGEAVMLNFTSPLFIPFLARAALGEALRRRALAAAAIGFVGVILIVQPATHAFTWHAVVALASAVFASAALVSVRALTRTENTVQVVFHFALGSAVLSAAPLPWFWQTPEAGQWIPLLVTGVLATVAQFLLTKGYARSPAAIAAVFHYLTVPAAAFFGWLFWGETIGLHTVAGAVLITAAGIAASWPSR